MCLPALRVLFFVVWDEAQHADGMDGSQRFLTTDPTSGFVRQAGAFYIELVASFRSGRSFSKRAWCKPTTAYHRVNKSLLLSVALSGIYPWQLSFSSCPMQCWLLRKARSFLVPVHWQRNHATSVNPVSYWLIRTGWIFIPERPIRATPLTCRTRLPFCVIVSSPQLLSDVPTRALCDLIPAGRLQAGPSSAEAHQQAYTHTHATGNTLYARWDFYGRAFCSCGRSPTPLSSRSHST